MKYQSGEEIRKGDKVLFHGEPGEIEFVADKLVGDPAMDWHMREQGPGVNRSALGVRTSGTRRMLKI